MSDCAVHVSGLTKRYRQVVAVDNLELEVPKGAVFGLLGPNGAGKSTTFGVLCGWVRPDYGKATVLDTPSSELHKLRGRVAALPQDAAFPRQISVQQQLAHFAELAGLSRHQAELEARRALAEVGMSQVAERKGGELSHGMLKKVGLAQALLGSPHVVFLDEPTAGLDPESARHVKDLIAARGGHMTLIVSSHNLAEIQEVCTHGAILDHGRRVAYGTIAELTRRGTEVTIELGAGATPPLTELRHVLGEENVHLPEPALLMVLCQRNEEVSTIIGRTLRVLLDHDTPVLGVRRGTSLENAFLEVTRGSG